MANIIKKQKAEENILTGFRGIDSLLSGLHNSDLIIIGGRPEMGKTALALGIAQYASSFENRKVLFCSIEMSKESICNRLFAMETETDLSKVHDDDPGMRARKDNINKSAVIWNKKIIIDDTSYLTVNEFREKCNNYHPELVIIDYLQLMIPVNGSKLDSPDGHLQDIFNICCELKKIAEELFIPIVILSVLQRFEKASVEKKPNLMFMQKMAQENQTADVVMLIYRDEFYHEDSIYKGIAEITVAKHNHGPLGRAYLSWIPQYVKFTDVNEKQMEIVNKSRQIEK